jgi:hypothetical protein
MSLIDGAIDSFSWGVTLVPNAAVNLFGDATSVVYTAAELFRRAGDDARRKLIEEVISPLPNIIPLEASLEAGRSIITRISTSVDRRVGELLGQVTDSILELAGHSLERATGRVLLEAVGKITAAILTATVNGFGQLPIIRNGVLSNGVNALTLQLVWDQRAELITFIVDIVECAKELVNANGSGSVNASQQHYNELDITKLMNRHGMICQLQRLVQSLVFIFQVPMNVDVENLADIDMTEITILESDSVPLTEHIEAAPSTPSKPPILDEHWLFINGIGGEYHWLGLACKKLAETYGREVVGIFNRGDGLLWDLVECAGQREDRAAGSSASQDSLIEATISSRDAQRALYTRLKSTLETPSEASGPVVVVAHSQGCLVLRLALQQLITDGGQGLVDTMKQRLFIFTFGNPSIHWTFERSGLRVGPQLSELEQLFRRMEHFANYTDFVAKLGVLRPTGAGAAVVSDRYSPDTVFVNTRWKGHLFGAQYSLNHNDYVNSAGQRSWLLNCTRGRGMGPPP